MSNKTDENKLVPVRVGGHVVAFRPAKKSAPKSSAKQESSGSNRKAEEATK